MKKRLYILFISAGLSVFTSCQDVLDVEPTASIEFEGAIIDARSADRALQGVYSAFQAGDYYGLSYLYYQDLYTDNLTFTGTFSTHREVASRNINPTNLQIANTWASIYTAIGRANVVIQEVNALANIEQEEKDRIVGEAHFLRGLAYFDLLKVFGGVPIVTKPTIDVGGIQNQGRSTEAEVYTQIISDLTVAETKLVADDEDVFSGSGWAATALLARVYLQQGNYAQARDKASNVIDNGPFSLEENFGKIFDASGTDNASSESIFELAFNEDDQNALASSSNPAVPGQKFYVSAGLFNLLSSDGGERFGETTLQQGTRRRVVKYDDVVNGSDNVVILRLAEMYLIRAEANARLGAAGAAPSQQVVDDINMIRNRAGVADANPATNAEALTEILKQRRLEFAVEGLRFMDLKRFGQTCAVLNFCPETAETQDNTFRNLWPLPFQQFETNPNLGKQNPGY
ncbi:RagB/SusD family nutrient uptake outer membrane protein [Nibribacter ruber]|uniref:RagB/SusD family nutrient uptake outer membrane protein n=1 Tax=Nibribacter ruber TaxID=2698458 RepID=A0A6P1NY31_9BACT|nr:RagB/SusD family nutrient uptake outer membrane protein [Nibribacter ruber]QHL87129.1 RagB/SusD family nutrient uptake outer membrane protein [Nibribacter ruber]